MNVQMKIVWFINWGIQAAWRRGLSDDGKPKPGKGEFSLRWEEPPQPKATDSCFAVFKDGTKKAMAAFTCADLWKKDGPVVEGGKRDIKTYWTGKDSDGHELVLRRTIRGEDFWLQLWDQSATKQIAQLVDCSPEAVAWMTTAAIRFSTGNLTKKNLNVRRRHTSNAAASSDPRPQSVHKKPLRRPMRQQNPQQKKKRSLAWLR